MYKLTLNNTTRALPETVSSFGFNRLAKRRLGESVGFDNGGDIALVFDADGHTLAEYTYVERVFSTEAYLNG
jgi:hypothetical protein